MEMLGMGPLGTRLISKGMQLIYTIGTLYVQLIFQVKIGILYTYMCIPQ